MTALALPRAARPLLDFIALLRRNGFPVAPEQSLAFLRAIELLGPRDIGDIRRAGVATLAPPFERQPDFDMLFDMHFLGLAGVLSDQVAESDEELEVQDDGAGYDALLSDDINETGQAATASEALSRRALRPGTMCRSCCGSIFWRASPMSSPVSGCGGNSAGPHGWPPPSPWRRRSCSRPSARTSPPVVPTSNAQ
mgnify:CR=1 FL=1